jgi:hypothetical protein
MNDGLIDRFALPAQAAQPKQADKSKSHAVLTPTARQRTAT